MRSVFNVAQAVEIDEAGFVRGLGKWNDTALLAYKRDPQTPKRFADDLRRILEIREIDAFALADKVLGVESQRREAEGEGLAGGGVRDWDRVEEAMVAAVANTERIASMEGEVACCFDQVDERKIAEIDGVQGKLVAVVLIFCVVVF